MIVRGGPIVYYPDNGTKLPRKARESDDGCHVGGWYGEVTVTASQASTFLPQPGSRYLAARIILFFISLGSLGVLESRPTRKQSYSFDFSGIFSYASVGTI